MTGSDHMGRAVHAQAFDDNYAPNDSAYGYFPAGNVLAARSQGLSSCWNPACGRVHSAPPTDGARQIVPLPT